MEKSSENHYDNFARRSLIEWACKSFVDVCLNDASTALKNYIDNKSQISNFLKQTILTQGTRTLDKEYFIKLWTRQQQSTNPLERLQIARALGAVHDLEIQKLLLNTLITNNEQIEGVDITYTQNERKTILNSIINNENVYSVFYEFWINESETIKKQ